MDYPQTEHPHDHYYKEDPHGGGRHSATESEGDEHPHEKKSVLKKVKAKAKKIKDTITKHGHGHHHEHDNDLDLDEEDVDDEEMGEAESPEVQGAPNAVYESTVISSRTIPAEEANVGQSRPSLERTTAMKEDPALVPKDSTTDTFGSQGLGKEDTSGQHGDNLGRPTPRFDPHVKEGIPEKSGLDLGGSMGLEEDPQAPNEKHEGFDPPNYQSKVADPTGDGGEEMGITPILRSFGKMSVDDKTEEQFTTGTGSHDQFSPEPLPTVTKPTENKPSNQGTYTEKISAAASAITDKAISAKNAAASKLGYGGNEKPEESHEGGDQSAAKTSSVTEYGKKIADKITEKLAPVYGKVAEAGGAVVWKEQGTGSETEEVREKQEEGYGAPDKGVSMKAYLAEKLKPSEEDKALSEVISDALHKRREETEDDKRSRPMGKVTQSEVVAKRLGTATGEKPSREGHEPGDVEFDSSSNLGSGSGVVDRLRGAVNSWFGKGGGGAGRERESLCASHGNEGFSSYDNNDGVRRGNNVGEEEKM